jgi:6-pyruvoyltetrahydropterin/6-carboxytetrahydropterin synthase
MIIRKEFRVESSHIVRNCTSHRCSHSVHGHSAVIEVLLEGRKLDNAGMLYDFGLMKGTVKQFIDSMDHCHLIWSEDNEEYKEFFKKTNDRWIELPFNPSAEQLSMFIHYYVQWILDHTLMNNGEDKLLKVNGIIYHETTTGYAQCDETDVKIWFNPEWMKQITFSDGVVKDWSKDLEDILSGRTVANPVIEQQVKNN